MCASQIGCDQRRVNRIFLGLVTSHSTGYFISSFPHIESITLGECEEIYEVAGIASCMNLVGIHEVGHSVGCLHIQDQFYIYVLCLCLLGK